LRTDRDKISDNRGCDRSRITSRKFNDEIGTTGSLEFLVAIYSLILFLLHETPRRNSVTFNVISISMPFSMRDRLFIALPLGASIFFNVISAHTRARCAYHAASLVKVGTQIAKRSQP